MDEMLRPEEVAAVLSCHVNTIRDLIRDGSLPAVRLRREYRVSTARLREWIDGGGVRRAADTTSR